MIYAANIFFYLANHHLSPNSPHWHLNREGNSLIDLRQIDFGRSAKRYGTILGPGIIVLSLLLSSDTFRDILLQNAPIAITLSAIALIAPIPLSIVTNNQLDDDAPSNETALGRRAVATRFSENADSWPSDKIYAQWFSSKLEMDYDEYCLIEDRGKFVRVCDIYFDSGNEETKRIAGYYSVFPISQATYDKLCSYQMKDRELKSSDVLDLDDPNAKVLYISEIVRSKDIGVLSFLLKDMLRYVSFIIHGNENVNLIAAWPYTRYGRKIADTARMKRNPKRFRSKYFEVSVNAARGRLPPPSEFRATKRIPL